MACSIVSTVKIPKPMGISSLVPTSAMPRLASLATWSKCGVAPLITQPSAINALYRRLVASFLMTSGVSKAPGTRTTSMSPAATPCFSSVPTAASSNRSTMKSLNREATMPKRKPRALKSPSSVLIRSSMRVFPFRGVRDVLDDLEAEARQGVQLLWRTDDSHAPHAERTHDLRADAEHAEIHAALALRVELGLGRHAQRLHRAHEIARRFLEPQDDDHAMIRVGDQLQGVAQRPVQRRSVQAEHVAQRVLPMHAHERRGFRVELASHQREMQGAIDVVLEADEAERAELRLDFSLAADFDRLFGPQSVLDEIGDRADLELVAPRKLHEVVAARHGAVVVQYLDDHGRRLDAGETGEIAPRLRMARA